VAAKKAARQAEEAKKIEIEDEEWGANVLDAMVDQLGTRKEVEKDIRNHRRKQEIAQCLANFSHAGEDGNPVMMTKNANRGFGASSRDANYRDNVHLLVGGGRERRFCAVPKCDHPKM
jgi:phosphatidylserine/phosphatidylglycerophosphate/cardiolipin synthase-like enzyme